MAAGCGVTQPVRPIDDGTTQLTASFGGPIIPIAGIAIPVPYLNVGVMHGARPNLTVYGNAHVTALLFKDVGLDAGIATRLLPEKGLRPEVTANLRGYFFWDAFRGSTTRFYPMASVTGSYRTGERSLAYLGTDVLYQFTTAEAFISPYIGCGFPVSEQFMLQLESKWLAMDHDTRHGVFEGAASIAGKGNIGIYAGLQYEWK